MKVSVIISTYNHPEWLEKALWGYECQTYKDFEVIIADDGSGESTQKLIDLFKKNSPLEIVHVWHEDRGFQKSQILNKAVVASTTDYLIFSDGDCIPRRDFVETHVKHAKIGHFLSGGYFMLPMSISKTITREDVTSRNVFSTRWLYEHGLRKTYKVLKLSGSYFLSKLMNTIAATKATWNGHNASGWKSNIIHVNGFNEEMQYGGQDREMGERLKNKGIKGKQIRYFAICVHLDHERGYKTAESISKNKKIRKQTKVLKRIWTEFGITKTNQPVS